MKSASSVPFDMSVSLKSAAFASVVRALISTGELRQKLDPLGTGKIAGRLTRSVDVLLFPGGSTKKQWPVSSSLVEWISLLYF